MRLEICLYTVFLSFCISDAMSSIDRLSCSERSFSIASLSSVTWGFSISCTRAIGMRSALPSSWISRLAPLYVNGHVLPVPRDHYRVHLAIEHEPVARQLDLLHYLGWPQPRHQGCRRDSPCCSFPYSMASVTLSQVQDASEVDDPGVVGVVPDVDDRYEGYLLAQRDSTSRSRPTILSIETPSSSNTFQFSSHEILEPNKGN